MTRPSARPLTSARDGSHPESPAQAFTGVGIFLVSLCVLCVYEALHLSGYSFGANAIYSVNDYDEGVYAATAALMAHGYALFSQIYSAQPPLFPTVLSLGDRLFGTGIVQDRVVMLIFGVLCLIGVAAIAVEVGGWVAGGMASLLLVISPEFLVYSHAIEEEIPVAALVALSLALAVAWYRSPGCFTAGSAGVLMGLAILTKFFAFATLVPTVILFGFALCSSIRSEKSSRDLRGVLFQGLEYVGCLAIPVVISLAIFGRDEWTQMVSDRVAASTGQAAIQSVSNVRQILEFAGADPGLAIVAVVGGLLLLLRDWRMGIVIDAWGLATLAVLLSYHPLMGHHPVILLPCEATLGGMGLASLWPRGASRVESGEKTGLVTLTTGWKTILAALAAGSLVLYVALLPRLALSYDALLVKPYGLDVTFAAAGRVVDRNSKPSWLMATGNAWICVDANRLCVPGLVDTSDVRVVTGKLTGRQAIADTTASHARIIALGRRLCDGPTMAPYVRWVRVNFTLVKPMPLESVGCLTRPNGQPVPPDEGIYLRLFHERGIP